MATERKRNLHPPSRSRTLVVEQLGSNLARIAAHLWDHLVGAALNGKAVYIIASEQNAELAADFGEVKAKIGNALPVDFDPNLREINLEIGVGEHELAASEAAPTN